MEKLLAQKLPFMRKDDYRKTKLEMMKVLFMTEQMATSSLTGGKGHNGSSKHLINTRFCSNSVSILTKKPGELLHVSLQLLVTNELSTVIFEWSMPISTNSA